MIARLFLIVRSDRTARVVSRYPSRLRIDEIGFRLNINYPNGWGELCGGDIEVMMPEPPSVTTIKQVEEIEPS